MKPRLPCGAIQASSYCKIVQHKQHSKLKYNEHKSYYKQAELANKQAEIYSSRQKRL